MAPPGGRCVVRRPSDSARAERRGQHHKDLLGSGHAFGNARLVNFVLGFRRQHVGAGCLAPDKARTSRWGCGQAQVQAEDREVRGGGRQDIRSLAMGRGRNPKAAFLRLQGCVPNPLQGLTSLILVTCWKVFLFFLNEGFRRASRYSALEWGRHPMAAFLRLHGCVPGPLRSLPALTDCCN